MLRCLVVVVALLLVGAPGFAAPPSAVEAESDGGLIFRASPRIVRTAGTPQPATPATSRSSPTGSPPAKAFAAELLGPRVGERATRGALLPRVAASAESPLPAPPPAAPRPPPVPPPRSA